MVGFGYLCRIRGRAESYVVVWMREKKLAQSWHICPRVGASGFDVRQQINTEFLKTDYVEAQIGIPRGRVTMVSRWK